MKIGWHTYEPGLWSDKPNSAGGSIWTKALMTHLIHSGHHIRWLGPQTILLGDLEIGPSLPEDVDVIVFYWRWQMSKSYKERNKAHVRQWAILNRCAKKGIPFLVIDGDHKMKKDDVLYIQKTTNGILTAPELAPRKGFERLIYPNSYPIRDPRAFRIPFFQENEMVYIGNNYERWTQWLEYIVAPSNLGMETICFGNWLEPHPDRQSPDEVKEVAPHIKFPGRLAQNSVIDQYLVHDCTVHLAKPSYCKTGFITMRWAEAAAGGCLGFIPEEFKHVPSELEHTVVGSGPELYERYRAMTEEEWFQLVHAQQEWVSSNMTYKPWLDMINEAVRRA